MSKRSGLVEGECIVCWEAYCDTTWQYSVGLDGHHYKLAAQQCAVPSIFVEFQQYNVPENYKQKWPNLKNENIAAMSQTLFDILQQVS